MLTIFSGIILTTWSWLMPSTQAQTILDTQEWLVIQSWCNTYIAGHDFKPLWDKITWLHIGDRVSVGSCKYKIVRRRVVYRELVPMSYFIQHNKLFLQTCYGDKILIVEGKRLK